MTDRLQPLSILGHGRKRTADKLQAVVHQTWLEYGPSAETVRAANLSVRGVLTDLGTELPIVDALDVVDKCLGLQDGLGDDEMGFLFPLALQVPGPQHLLDQSLRYGISSIWVVASLPGRCQESGAVAPQTVTSGCID